MVQLRPLALLAALTAGTAAHATSHPLRLTHAYPDNVAFPIVANCPQVVDTKSFLANPKCWVADLTNMKAQFEALKKQGAKASGTITVESTADLDAATNRRPDGYTQAQVDISVARPPSNLKLAQMRGEVMKAALVQIFGVSAASITVKAQDKQPVKSVIAKGLVISDVGSPTNVDIPGTLTCGFKAVQSGGQGDKEKRYLFHTAGKDYTTMLPASSTAGAKSVKLIFNAYGIPDQITVWTGSPGGAVTYAGWHGDFGLKLDDARTAKFVDLGCKFFLKGLPAAEGKGIDCAKTSGIDSLSGTLQLLAKKSNHANVWAPLVAKFDASLIDAAQAKDGALKTRKGSDMVHTISVAAGKDIYIGVTSPIPGTLFDVTPICE